MTQNPPESIPETEVEHYSPTLEIDAGTVIFRSIKPRDVKPVTELWEDRLGTPPDAHIEWIRHGLQEPRPTEILIAECDTEIVGFGVVTIGGPEWVHGYIDHPELTVTCWRDTGVLHALCVAADYQSNGIGTELVGWQLQYLSNRGVDGVLAVSWHRDEHYDSRPLFEKFDFEADVIAPEFYATTPGETYCTDCENGCECGSTVFVRELPIDHGETQPTNYPQVQ